MPIICIVKHVCLLLNRFENKLEEFKSLGAEKKSLNQNQFSEIRA
jgi:hypothetical protein